MHGGIEWLVDASGCSPMRLRDHSAVFDLLDRIVSDMKLHVAGTAWQAFPDPGGITVMYLLAESHLTIHTFPETGTATLNAYCCRPRTPADWNQLLRDVLGATHVDVRELVRGQP
ncbi:MAG TPA: S-adenosylmethionine decarboxylase [Kofleriaceae bacterium]|jgi:S-adenosylmethionine decarboxylase|nr:S-adenosylmethionine decarboxylase [Kofleriaceae bacterium]